MIVQNLKVVLASTFHISNILEKRIVSHRKYEWVLSSFLNKSAE